MRVIIQELLHPPKPLGSVGKFGQVMIDVACSGCPPPLTIQLPLADTNVVL